MLLSEEHEEKALFGISPFDSEHFDAADWSKGGISLPPLRIRFHLGVMFARGRHVKKGAVSDRYFNVLKFCVLINVATGGEDGAYRCDESRRACASVRVFLILFVWIHSSSVRAAWLPICMCVCVCAAW